MKTDMRIVPTGCREQECLSVSRLDRQARVILAVPLILAAYCFTAQANAKPGSAAAEVILSATSSDGRTFVQDEGYRLTNGYVDPFVLQAQNGNWRMLVSTTPSSNRLPQQIHMAASTDGLNWQVDTNVLISVTGGNALDPTAVALGDGSYRVYYVATSTPDPFTGFYLASGILQTNQAGKWNFTEDGVSLGIAGVSPEAWALAGNAVRIYITASTGGMKVYRAEDGLTFTEETASLPMGSDPTIIELQDHRLRMYYIIRDLSGLKEIFTALSTNGLSWTDEGTTGISSDAASGDAWGVPDSFIDPDNHVRLFWVSTPTNTSSASMASPLPVFSAQVGGNILGRIQPGGAGNAVNFIGLSDAAWNTCKLIGATGHAPGPGQIAVVVMDRATQVPYLVLADENNNYQGHSPLFGLTDPGVWATYAVDAAGDLDADGRVEYVVRDRNTGSTLLAYTSESSNQLQTTGYVLGIDPLALAGYRIEVAGDADGDGYADLAVRELGSGLVYMVHNSGAGGYDQVQLLFGFAADTWASYRLESTGDFNGDGFLDYIAQDTAGTVSYKLFGTGRNGFSRTEIIP